MSNLFIPEGQYDRVAVIAPGPSLTDEQIDKIMAAGIFTIGIGSVVFRNPFTDLLYHCDAKWWRHYEGVPEFHGCQRVSLEAVPELPLIRSMIQSEQSEGIDLTASTLVAGSNSGYQAIGLAAHYRPKEIILVGYDMKIKPDGTYNCIGNHPQRLQVPQEGKFEYFIKTMEGLVDPLEKLGITVYNSTIDTDLHCFEQRPLDDVIARQS